MFRSETLSLSIDCPHHDVYDFLIEPRNVPNWGANPGDAIRHVGGNDWVTDTPQGPLTLRLPARNRFGVLDRCVLRPGDEPVVTPMRVVANGDGAELTCTLRQGLGMSSTQFACEMERVRADLLTLKSVLESRMRR